MMKRFDLARPDKIILSGLKTLSDFSFSLYAEQKSEAKGTGEFTFIGEQKIKSVKTQLYRYNLEELEISNEVSDYHFLSEPSSDLVTWFNVHGLHDVQVIEGLGQALALDRITIRQTLDTTLRPKVEEYENYLFFSIKSILKDEKAGLKVEQISYVLGNNYVTSFQEEVSDHFDRIRNKIEENLGLVRKKGADFLLYQLLDAILDNYFETIEAVNLDILELEKMVLTNPVQNTILKLEQTKHLAVIIKKSLVPFKDSLRTIQNRKVPFIAEDNQKYFSDLANNCLSAIEEIEATTKSLEGLTNIYFSSLSQKMNETMKVLTTVATIFIPLTFIAGIYGMNFENMPELKWRYGYFSIWGVMVLIFGFMIYYFKKKRWL